MLTASCCLLRLFFTPFCARLLSLPILQRFPELAALPRAALGLFPSPIQRIVLPDDTALWLKRDDLDAAEFGGNKVRSLEFLLGGIGAGDRVLTVGGDGSTHVLATAAHAARLGARTTAVRWRHDMNPVAELVAQEARRRCEHVYESRTAAGALVRAWLLRLTSDARYVPAGGSVPLGILGQVNAALELAEQISAGQCPRPERVVVPLGSGGTAAGLALGFAITGLPIVVVGARVAPRIAANRSRLLWLARATAKLIARATGAIVPAVRRERLLVAHDAYGGAYGRSLAAGDAAASLLRRLGGPALDATYGAKAASVALTLARDAPGVTLFWVTFDSRWMDRDFGLRAAD
jgi:D-cysteine desulfhydrase